MEISAVNSENCVQLITISGDGLVKVSGVSLNKHTLVPKG